MTWQSVTIVSKPDCVWNQQHNRSASHFWVATHQFDSLWRGSLCPVLTQQCLFRDLRSSKLHFLLALFHGSPYKFNYNLIYCQALLRGSQPPPMDNAAYFGRKGVPEKHPNIKGGFHNCCFEMQWDTVASDGKCDQIISDTAHWANYSLVNSGHDHVLKYRGSRWDNSNNG